MNSPSFCTSTCRLCSSYQPEGRRGGICQQLGVPVKGCWKACSLAIQPFAQAEWDHLEDNIAHLEKSLQSLVSDYTHLEAIADEFHPDSTRRQGETLSA